MTISELQEAYANGSMTTREAIDGYLARIEEQDPTIGAFLDVYAADARLQADEIDARRARGEALGPLAGVPVAMKNNILVEGKPTMGGSRVLEGYIAPYSATVVERLRAADAIVIGSTNMDEFGCGSSTENSGYGITKNPIDHDRVPVGS